MYNEKLKNEFINYRLEENETPFSPKYLNNWFNKSESFEEKYRKDLSEFNEAEIIDFYKSVDTSSYLTLRTLNSNLKIYNDWCQKKGLIKSGKNYFKDINRSDLSSCINVQKKTESIITRKELEDWCDYDIKNFRDQFIFLCLFEGIKGKDYGEIVNLKFRHLSCKINEQGIKSYYAHISGEFERDIEISSKLYYTALSAYQCDDYVTLGNSGRIIKLKENDQCIFKGYMNQDLTNTSDHQKGKVIYTIVKRNLDVIESKNNNQIDTENMSRLSPSCIQVSGMIYYIKQHSKKLNCTPMEFIANEVYRNELGKQFGTNIDKNYFVDRNRDILVD